MTLDVGIIGCGTAGGAAALFLARAGHRITVYERVPDPRPVGAGIVLQPTGQAVLARLGLARDVLSRGARLDGLHCRNDRGRTVVELTYEDVGSELFGLGTHRGVLFSALFRAAQRECTVRCGVSIESLARTRKGVVAVDAEGARHGPHDLLIVADGARSRLRDDVPQIAQRIRPYPWGALWFLANDPERGFRDRLFQVVRGAGRMLGFLPTGVGPSGEVPVTSIYWSIRADAVASFRRRGVAPWKDEIRAMLDHDRQALAAAEPLLGQIEDESQLLFAAYNDVEIAPFGDDRVVFLGDAAHAMSPQLGQGCNLALLDALTLAECLHVFGEPARAVAAYSLRRRRHLGVYAQATRWLTPFFQGDAEILGDLRDMLMPLAARVPPMRALMTRSMAGMLGDWFGGTIALPARESLVPGLPV